MFCRNLYAVFGYPVFTFNYFSQSKAKDKFSSFILFSYLIKVGCVCVGSVCGQMKITFYIDGNKKSDVINVYSMAGM